MQQFEKKGGSDIRSLQFQLVTKRDLGYSFDKAIIKRAMKTTDTIRIGVGKKE